MIWTIMGWFSVAVLALAGLFIVADNKHKGSVRVITVIVNGIMAAYVLHSLLT